MIEQRIESDLSGTVCRIECSEGARVAEGDPLLIVESMKMEIPIVAPAAGTVIRVLASVGELVSEGQVVVIVGTT